MRVFILAEGESSIEILPEVGLLGGLNVFQDGIINGLLEGLSLSGYFLLL